MVVLEKIIKRSDGGGWLYFKETEDRERVRVIKATWRTEEEGKDELESDCTWLIGVDSKEAAINMRRVNTRRIKMTCH